MEALLAEAAVGAVREALEYPSRQLESGISLDEGLRMFLAALDGFAPDEPVNLLFIETFLAAARGGCCGMNWRKCYWISAAAPPVGWSVWISTATPTPRLPFWLPRSTG